MSRPIDLLLGRLAVERGFARRDQIDAGLRIQQDAHPEPPLGIILLDAGLLTLAQVDELLRIQREEWARLDSRLTDRAEAWRFGRLAVERGNVPVEEVRRSLREQARREEAGEPGGPLGRNLVVLPLRLLLRFLRQPSGRRVGERRRAREQLIERRPHRVDVRPPVHFRRLGELLRAHVQRRAEHLPGLGERAQRRAGLRSGVHAHIVLGELCEAEVDHARGQARAVARDEDIARLDVRAGCRARGKSAAPPPPGARSRPRREP